MNNEMINQNEAPGNARAIPPGIRYCAEHDNFYNGDAGMGQGFYERWIDRKAEFPTAPATAPGNASDALEDTGCEPGKCGCDLCAPAAPDLAADDIAVDKFAAAMKAKMAASRAKGRGGWQDKTECTRERLAGMLADHVVKGDPVDVGNFAMMLFNRGEATTPVAPDRAGEVTELKTQIQFERDQSANAREAAQRAIKVAYEAGLQAASRQQVSAPKEKP